MLLERLKKESTEVIILMSTYNGERYLVDQISSILNQKGVQIRLVIRDDGSVDSTLDILKKLADQNQERILLLPSNGQNLGSAESFMCLLNYALDMLPAAPFYSFADQDDYWLEEKLLRAVDKIKNCEKEALYLSQKQIVDENLNILHQEDVKIFEGSFLRFLTISNASGCTFLLNHKLAEKCRRKPNIKGIHHDAWVYRISGSIGGFIYEDPKSYILYRQHGNNVVGKVEYWNMKKAFQHSRHKRNHILQKTYRAINEQFADEICGKAKEVVPWICDYTDNYHSRFKLIFWKEPRMFGLKTTIIWIMKVVLNGI